MSKIDIKGVITAIVTPMKADGSIDWNSLERLVDQQIAAGISGLVPMGTTGESPTLDYDEHIEVIRFVAEKARKRVPVWAGAGANSTSEALLLTGKAEKAGADGFLHVAPYYNKPTQDGLFAHFAKIAESTAKPIMLYSIPGRCGIEILPQTTARLYARYPHICAMKEAAGNCDRVAETLNLCGDSFTVLSGDDGLGLPFMSAGAKGIVSVASNLVPEKLVALVNMALANDFASASVLHRQLYPLFKGLFVEANPVPVKYAMVRKGLLDSPAVRLPLVELSDENRAFLDSLLKANGIA